LVVYKSKRLAVEIVMNNTCIHLRAKDPNIYMYKRGENIQRTHWRKTIIEKANTYLMSPQTHGGSTTLSLKR
jgi:hypothetical protein